MAEWPTAGGLFAPLTLLLPSFPATPALPLLEPLLSQRTILTQSGQALRFAAPPNDGLAYEQRIWQNGVVATRPGCWHDFFNALVWLSFPRSKAVLNARHVCLSTLESARRGRGLARRCRDARARRCARGERERCAARRRRPVQRGVRQPTAHDHERVPLRGAVPRVVRRWVGRLRWTRVERVRDGPLRARQLWELWHPVRGCALLLPRWMSSAVSAHATRLHPHTGAPTASVVGGAPTSTFDSASYARNAAPTK